MKRCLIVVLLFTSLIVFTGCQPSSEKKVTILDALKENNIISKDIEYVDTVTKMSSGAIPINIPYDIYKDNGKLIAIYIDKDVNKNNDYDFIVIIYTDVTINEENRVYVSEDEKAETYYRYKNDNKITNNNIYTLNDMKEYHLYENKNSYTIKEA